MTVGSGDGLVHLTFAKIMGIGPCLVSGSVVEDASEASLALCLNFAWMCKLFNSSLVQFDAHERRGTVSLVR